MAQSLFASALLLAAALSLGRTASLTSTDTRLHLHISSPRRGQWVPPDVAISYTMRWDTDLMPRLCFSGRCRCERSTASDLLWKCAPPAGSRPASQPSGHGNNNSDSHAMRLVEHPFKICFDIVSGPAAVATGRGPVGCGPLVANSPLHLTGFPEGSYKANATLHYNDELGGHQAAEPFTFSFHVADPSNLCAHLGGGSRGGGSGGCSSGSDSSNAHHGDGSSTSPFNSDYRQLGLLVATGNTGRNTSDWPPGRSLLELHANAASGKGNDSAGLLAVAALLHGFDRGYVFSEQPLPPPLGEATSGVAEMRGFQARAGFTFGANSRKRAAAALRIRSLLDGVAGFDVVAVLGPEDVASALAMLRLGLEFVARGGGGGGGGGGQRQEEGRIYFRPGGQLLAENSRGGRAALERLLESEPAIARFERAGSRAYLVTAAAAAAAAVPRSPSIATTASSKQASPATAPGPASAGRRDHYDDHHDRDPRSRIGLAARDCDNGNSASPSRVHFNLGRGANVGTACNVCFDPQQDAFWFQPAAAAATAATASASATASAGVTSGRDSPKPQQQRLFSDDLRADLALGHNGFKFGWDFRVLDAKTTTTLGKRPGIIAGPWQDVPQRWYGRQGSSSEQPQQAPGDGETTTTTTVFLRPPMHRHTTHFAEGTFLLFHASRFARTVHTWLQTTRRIVLLGVPRDDMEYNQRFLGLVLAAVKAELQRQRLDDDHDMASCADTSSSVDDQGRPSCPHRRRESARRRQQLPLPTFEIWHSEDLARTDGRHYFDGLSCFAHAVFLGMIGQEWGLFADEAEANVFRAHTWRHLGILPPEPPLERDGNEPMKTFLIARPGSSSTDEPSRRMLNRAAVVERLSQTGLVDLDGWLRWTERDFAKMPFRDQLLSMHRADLVIGVHGSGLLNAIFMPPGGVVIEIFPGPFVRYDWHHHLTSAGMRHLFLLPAANHQPREVALSPSPSSSSSSSSPRPPDLCRNATLFEAGDNACRAMRNVDALVDIDALEVLVRQADFLVRNVKRRTARRVSSRSDWGRGRRSDGSMEDLMAEV